MYIRLVRNMLGEDSEADQDTVLRPPQVRDGS